MSPAKSKAQQRMMAMDLARKRAGKKTKTHMTEKQMEEFASTPTKHLPMKKRSMVVKKKAQPKKKKK